MNPDQDQQQDPVEDESRPKVPPPYEKGIGTGTEEPETGPTVPDPGEPTDPDTGPVDVPAKPEIDPLTGEPLPDLN